MDLELCLQIILAPFPHHTPSSLLPFWWLQPPRNGLGICEWLPRPFRLNMVGLYVCFALARDEGSVSVIMDQLSPSEPGT